MAKPKKPRKRYRPIPVIVNPLKLLAPAPKEDRDRVMAAFNSALDMMARHENPNRAEWEQLADAVNQVETLAMEMGCLDPDEVMPSVDQAIKAMAECAKRWRAGGPLRLSGPGLEALRDVIAFFEQALECLTGAEMAKARDLTQARINRARCGNLPPNVEVVEA